MRNTTDDFGSSSLEEVKIEGIDQQKAQAAWTKLEEETQYVDQTLRHPKHTFYVAKQIADYVQEPHYDIAVMKPEADADKDELLRDLLLVQEEKGFSVRDDIDSEAGQTSLTASEVNSLLEQIANSTRETDEKTGEAEDVIRQTRERIQ